MSTTTTRPPAPPPAEPTDHEGRPLPPGRNKIIVSISYGDVRDPHYTRTQHFMTFSDVDLNAKQAEFTADAIADALVNMGGHEKTFGMYKEDFPMSLHRSGDPSTPT